MLNLISNERHRQRILSTICYSIANNAWLCQKSTFTFMKYAQLIKTMVFNLFETLSYIYIYINVRTLIGNKFANDFEFFSSFFSFSYLSCFYSVCNIIVRFSDRSPTVYYFPLHCLWAVLLICSPTSYSHPSGRKRSNEQPYCRPHLSSDCLWNNESNRKR